MPKTCVSLGQCVFVGLFLCQAPFANATDSSNSEAKLYRLLEAEFAYDRRDVTKALQIYKREAFSSDSKDVFERAYQLSLLHENVDKSLDFVFEWQKRHPNHKAARFYIAHLALLAHDYTLAIANLTQILKEDPNADLEQVLQDIYPTKTEDKKKLLATLQQLNYSNSPNLSILKAGLLLELGYAKYALKDVNIALSFAPDNISYILLKADILKQLGNSKPLIDFLREERKELPDEKKLYTYEIRHLLSIPPTVKNNSTQKAWELSLHANQHFTDDAEIKLLTVLIGLELQKYYEVNAHLKELVKNPDYTDKAYYYLGLTAQKQGDHQQAKEYFSEIKDPKIAFDATKRVVEFEINRNNLGNAINALVEFRKNFTTYAPDSYIMQANLLKKADKQVQAKDLLEKAYDNYNNHEEIEFAYANMLNKETDYQKKLSILNKLRSNYPKNLDYKLHHALLLLARSSDNRHAQKAIEEIIAVPTSDTRFDKQRYRTALIALGSLAVAHEDYKQAIAYLELPYKEDPSLISGRLLLKSYRELGHESLLHPLKDELKKIFNYTE